MLTSDKKLKKDESFLFDSIDTDSSDTIHRKLLKYILGLSKASPNLAVYGETEEVPISFKGHRLMLSYWNRLTNLPDQSLAKKVYPENVSLRTNWLLTIEKLLKIFNLIGVPEGKFRATSKFPLWYPNQIKNFKKF